MSRNVSPFIVLPVLLALSVPTHANASLSVLAFDEDIESALVRLDDSNHGVMIQIRDLQTGKVKKNWFVESKNDESKRVKRLTRKRFPIEAASGQIDPKGRYTIIGAPDGRRSYNIMVMRDGRVGVLRQIPLKKGADEKYARAMLTEVVWTPDGKQVVVVLTQEFEQEYGQQKIDELHWVRFRQWKIKWLKPEVDQSDSDSNEQPR